MQEKLLQLQREIYLSETAGVDSQEKCDFYVGYSAMLYFFPVGDFFSISFYGRGYDDNPNIKAKELDSNYNVSFCRFLDFICEQDNAEKIVSLTFDSPDEGANGTNGWDFSRIINSDVVFPNLESLKVKLTDMGDHNQSVIDSQGSLNEDGMIAKLVKKMPNLVSLAVPSAPNKSFFEIGKHPLRQLVVQAGYNAQDFIENFAESNNFYNLGALDFSDLHDTLDCFSEDDFIPFESYKKLFESKAFSTSKHFHFTLRNANLSKEQLYELQKANNSVQFLYIEKFKSRYVSNMMKRDD